MFSICPMEKFDYEGVCNKQSECRKCNRFDNRHYSCKVVSFGKRRMIQKVFINFLILKYKRRKKRERYKWRLQHADAGHLLLSLRANEKLVVRCAY